MNHDASFKVLRGTGIAPYIEDAARLRSQVFAEWPYLYQGDAGYEREYLSAYAASPDSVFVLAVAGDAVVGISTGLPLADDASAFQQPFIEAGRDPATVFYFGESVLQAPWRGLGIGHAFFDARQSHARSLGRFDCTAFCAVDRADDDPRRPAGYRGNEVFWQKRGYQRQPQLRVRLHWPELGAGHVPHQLTFWTRALERQQ